MIYLMRHGLDDENYIGGWSDIDLTSDGKKQIIESTEFIIKNKLPINKIISSDIKRAVTTSKIVNKKLQVPIYYSDKLRELDKGVYTGRLKSTLSIKDISFIKNLTIYDKYPEGESMIELYKRMKLFLNTIKEDNILLITHRGVINMFYYILNDIFVDMDKEKFGVEHGSIHEMNISKKFIRRIY